MGLLLRWLSMRSWGCDDVITAARQALDGMQEGAGEGADMLAACLQRQAPTAQCPRAAVGRWAPGPDERLQELVSHAVAPWQGGCNPRSPCCAVRSTHRVTCLGAVACCTGRRARLLHSHRMLLWHAMAF